MLLAPTGHVRLALAFHTLACLLLSACATPDKYMVVDASSYRAIAEGRDPGNGLRIEAVNKKKEFVLPDLHYGFATVLGVSGGVVTPIPAGTFTINPIKGDLAPIGLEFIFGGALAPGNGETNIGVAGGVGVCYPISGGGYLTIGYVGWSEDDGSHNGLMVGFNFGSNPVHPPTGQ